MFRRRLDLDRCREQLGGLGRRVPGYKLDGVDGPRTANDLDYGYDAGWRVTSIARSGQSLGLSYNAAGQVSKSAL